MGDILPPYCRDVYGGREFCQYIADRYLLSQHLPKRVHLFIAYATYVKCSVLSLFMYSEIGYD